MNINWRNIRLVGIGNHFAIREGWFFHVYLDFNTRGFWWSKCSLHFSDCLLVDEDIVTDMYYRIIGLDEVTLL